MRYTKENLIKLLKDKGVSVTGKSVAALLILALDNDVITREDVIKQDKLDTDVEKKPRGRPRKYPPKERKPVDPKYHRLVENHENPRAVRITNIETGEVKCYSSLYKAKLDIGHGSGYYIRNNGKVVDGIKIEVDYDK